LPPPRPALCAQRFQQAALINGRLVAQGPANLVLDQKLLAETYGGHVLILHADGGSALALDDAHHTTRRRAVSSITRGRPPLMDLIGILTHPFSLAFMQRGLLAALLVGSCRVMARSLCSRALHSSGTR